MSAYPAAGLSLALWCCVHSGGALPPTGLLSAVSAVSPVSPPGTWAAPFAAEMRGWTQGGILRPPSTQPALVPLPVIDPERFPADTREALAPALERARRAPDDAESVGALGMTLQAWEQWDAAHAAYQRARALTETPSPLRGERVGVRGLEPETPGPSSSAFRWAYVDAVVLQRIGRADEAVNALRAALEARADYLPARVKLAEALFDSGQMDESARLYRELVNEPAAEPIAQLGLGRIAAAGGRHDEALPHLARAIALFPEFGAAHYALARSARALGRTEEAQRALAQHQQFGARWPAIPDPVLDEVTALRSDARASLRRGQKLAEAGDVEGAIAAHEEALARMRSSSSSAIRPQSQSQSRSKSSSASPSHPPSPAASTSSLPSSSPELSIQAHVELIALYGRVQNWTKAEEHYRAAVAGVGARGATSAAPGGGTPTSGSGASPTGPDRAGGDRAGGDLAEAHYNYGVLLGLQDRRDEAAAAYRQALEINPLNAQARNNLGHILERDRKFDEAAAEYRRAVEATPSFRLARFNLGRMLIALGRPQDAIPELARLTEPRDAEAPRYLFALATAYVRAGQASEGVKWATEARSLALEHGQQDLAAAIERHLASLR